MVCHYPTGILGPLWVVGASWGPRTIGAPHKVEGRDVANIAGGDPSGGTRSPSRISVPSNAGTPAAARDPASVVKIPGARVQRRSCTSPAWSREWAATVPAAGDVGHLHLSRPPTPVCGRWDGSAISGSDAFAKSSDIAFGSGPFRVSMSSSGPVAGPRSPARSVRKRRRIGWRLSKGKGRKALTIPIEDALDDVIAASMRTSASGPSPLAAPSPAAGG